ncbi:MAG TPA: hypothetical protein VK447_18220 [Myxococcaceae bacterium]|nr:hypothetical protein [Myxococcaceae bacterium]
MSPAVTYGLLALCGAVFLLSFLVDYSRAPRFQRVRRYSWLLTIASLAGAYAVIVPGADDGRAALRESQAAQRPLFMEFFSKT